MGFSHARLGVAGENKSMSKLRSQPAHKSPPDKEGWGMARLAGLLAILALAFSVCVIAYVAMQLF